MVKTLHAAGIEVILDVVYNHTAEGNHLGPTLSFRGIDNPVYYRLVQDNPRLYVDVTGTGNTLNVRNPNTLRMVMDSLRYWVHGDARRRLPLRSRSGARPRGVRRRSRGIVLRRHPPGSSPGRGQADRGAVGYRRERLPRRQIPHWLVGVERQVSRRRCATSGAATRAGSPIMGYRLTGSSDLYKADGRQPYASINFVTAHDGFTLRDLVSYDHKHNWANGEENRDGSDDNISSNYGHRGSDERLGDPGHPRPAAAELSGHPLPVPGHADASRRR